ncbi:MAG: aminopeptidase P family protein [Acidisphaera sp.]|nr:aminopeptidase P family protein [Acidisphaera sp.]
MQDEFSAPGRHTSRIRPDQRPASPVEGEPPPVGRELLARIAAIDEDAMRHWRLSRLRAELQRLDVAGALLADPINIRYATGTRNMAVWTMHAPGRYAFVATDGPVVLFEFAATRHVTAGSPTVDETRDSTPWISFLAGPRVEEKAALWAEEVASLVAAHGGGNRRLAVDRCDPPGALRLHALGLALVDVQGAIEQARRIKSPEERACLRASMEVCDIAVERMRAALRPGITENQLWAILHAVNTAHGGEWIEARALVSGPRTNPWFQECGDRVIEAGEIVAFDTDMVGPHGYLADISRTLICPDRPATDRQRALLAQSEEQVLFNTSLLRPGLSFRDFAERSWPVPERFLANRYMMMVHGVGFVDEYPSVAYVQDWNAWGFDGVFEENMVVSVESYIGETGGPDGVKLEQQVLITAGGAELLSRTPLLT